MYETYYPSLDLQPPVVYDPINHWIITGSESEIFMLNATSGEPLYYNNYPDGDVCSGHQ